MFFSFKCNDFNDFLFWESEVELLWGFASSILSISSSIEVVSDKDKFSSLSDKDLSFSFGLFLFLLLFGYRLYNLDGLF